MPKRHNYEERLKYMKMLEEGYSINFIHKHYGINGELLFTLWEQYKVHGAAALVRKKNCRLSVEQKMSVIAELKEKHVSLHDIMLNHGVSESAILSWRKRYDKGGVNALRDKPKGRPRKDMGRPKKKKPEEMTELERLRYENERLRAENALLKQEKALVEEREARLKGTGRRPSKD